MQKLKIKLSQEEFRQLVTLLMAFNPLWILDDNTRLMATMIMQALLKRLGSRLPAKTIKLSLKPGEAAALLVVFEHFNYTYVRLGHYERTLINRMNAEIHKFLTDISIQ